MIDWQLFKRAESQAQQIGSYKGEDQSHDMNARPVFAQGQAETPTTDKPTGDQGCGSELVAMRGQSSAVKQAGKLPPGTPAPGEGPYDPGEEEAARWEAGKPSPEWQGHYEENKRQVADAMAWPNLVKIREEKNPGWLSRLFGAEPQEALYAHEGTPTYLDAMQQKSLNAEYPGMLARLFGAKGPEGFIDPAGSPDWPEQLAAKGITDLRDFDTGDYFGKTTRGDPVVWSHESNQLEPVSKKWWDEVAESIDPVELQKSARFRVAKPPQGYLAALKKALMNKHNWRLSANFGLFGPIGGGIMNYRQLKRKRKPKKQVPEDMKAELAAKTASDENEPGMKNPTITPKTQSKVTRFLKRNPKADDASFHEFAENAGLNSHAAEAAAYRTASECLNAPIAKSAADFMEQLQKEDDAIREVQSTRELMRQNRRRMRRGRRRRRRRKSALAMFKLAEGDSATKVERPGGMSMGSALKAPTVTQSVPATPSQKVLNAKKVTAPALPIDTHLRPTGGMGYTGSMRFNTLTNQNY